MIDMPPLPLYPGTGQINWGAMSDQQQQDDRYAQDRAQIIRMQMESDREYELRVQAAKRQKEQIAIQRGQAEATRWYNEQMIQITRDKMAEDSRQFNVTASGYLDGKPTLARETWQDSALQGWADKAISLSMQPKNWVALKRMNSGVADNIGSIPGLSWAAGGQVGNTRFVGNPETNSLSNVLGNMGVNVGQGGSGGTTTGAGNNWASSAAQTADSIANANPNLTSQEQQIYQTADEFARNPQGAAPGWYESLDPLTKSLLEGAAQSQGHDWSTAMSRYKRSRWGGGGGAQAA